MTDRAQPPGGAPSACPFLALAEDRDRRSPVPDLRHRCYAEPAPIAPALSWQKEACCTPGFGGCRVFLGWAARAAAPAVGDPTSADPIVRAVPAEAADAGAGAGTRTASSAADPRGAAPADGTPSPEPDPADPALPFAWAVPPPWVAEPEIRTTAGIDEGSVTVPAPEPDPAPRPARGDADIPWTVPGERTGPMPGTFAGRREPGLPAPDPDGDAGTGASSAPAGRYLAALLARQRPEAPDDEDPAFLPPDPPATAPVPEPLPEPLPATAVLAEPERFARRGARRRGVLVDAGAPTSFAPQAGPRTVGSGEWNRPRGSSVPGPSRRDGLPSLVAPVAIGAAILLVAAVLIFMLPGFIAGGPAPTATPSAAPSLAAATVAPVATEAPPSEEPERMKSYRVQRGDTLIDIARRFGLELDQIACVNSGLKKNTDFVWVGQVLTIPPKDYVCRRPRSTDSP